MAVSGRKPKPTAIKRLAGNPGKRPLNDREPRPEVPSARTPRGISAGAGKFWRGLARDLIEMGVLRVTDVPAFLLMAEHYSIARAAAEAIDKDGLTVVDENKCQRKHPLLQVLRDNSTAYRLYASEFGLTPSSRGRLQVAPLEDEPSLAELLFAGVDE